MENKNGDVCPVVNQSGKPGGAEQFVNSLLFLAGGTYLPISHSFRENALRFFVNHQPNEIHFSKVLQKGRRFELS